jgi:hypothetical protein
VSYKQWLVKKELSVVKALRAWRVFLNFSLLLILGISLSGCVFFPFRERGGYGGRGEMHEHGEFHGGHER